MKTIPEPPFHREDIIQHRTLGVQFRVTAVYESEYVVVPMDEPERALKLDRELASHWYVRRDAPMSRYKR